MHNAIFIYSNHASLKSLIVFTLGCTFQESLFRDNQAELCPPIAVFIGYNVDLIS
nr:MAG TPA: hypothetical protein [Caudoviricetes sp.]